MPLTGTYQWFDKKDQILVEIPLKGVSPSKVDILATASTLKVNYAPYLIDIILSKPIDALRHKARVKDGILIITLFKVHQEPWQEFEFNEENENLKNQMKSEAILKYNELETDLEIKRKDKRIADERFSTKKQMNLEENERNRLEIKKEEEKKNAEEELYATFANMEMKEKSEEKTQKVQWAKSVGRECQGIDEISDEDEEEDEVGDLTAVRGENDEIQEIYSSSVEIYSSPSSSSRQQTSAQDDEQDEEIKYIPPPRHSGAAGGSSSASTRVGITFTPRIFPTPMRESKQAEEEDWIAKNRKYLSKHGQLGGNGVNRRTGTGGDISEEDPFWLKAKADDFYRNRDYQSAINAYSSALELDENYISCYLNRSLCYLQLSDPLNCLSDCRDGLNILDKQLDEMGAAGGRGSVGGGSEEETEELLKLKKMKQKLLFRKGICHCHLGEYSEALRDYQEGHALMISLEMNREAAAAGEGEGETSKAAAMAIDSIANDILKLQQLELCHELKKRADTAFGQKNLLEALSLYGQALDLVPYHVGCLSNRAACKIALSDLEGCVKDSTMALEILNRTENSKNLLADVGKDSLNMMTAIIPSAGSDKRKSWYLKTLVRRGATYFQLQRLDEAIADYGLACSMDPSNTSLKNDLTNLANLRTAAAVGGGGAAAVTQKQSNN